MFVLGNAPFYIKEDDTVSQRVFCFVVAVDHLRALAYCVTPKLGFNWYDTSWGCILLARPGNNATSGNWPLTLLADELPTSGE